MMLRSVSAEPDCEHRTDGRLPVVWETSAEALRCFEVESIHGLSDQSWLWERSSGFPYSIPLQGRQPYY